MPRARKEIAVIASSDLFGTLFVDLLSATGRTAVQLKPGDRVRAERPPKLLILQVDSPMTRYAYRVRQRTIEAGGVVIRTYRQAFVDRIPRTHAAIDDLWICEPWDTGEFKALLELAESRIRKAKPKAPKIKGLNPTQKSLLLSLEANGFISTSEMSRYHFHKLKAKLTEAGYGDEPIVKDTVYILRTE